MARKILDGLAVSPGIAIGKIAILGTTGLYERREISEAEIDTELLAIDQASMDVRNHLENTLSQTSSDLTEIRDLITTQLELARDPKIIEGAKARIRRRKICSSWAIAETINELAHLFKGFSDQYMSERAQDITAIGRILTQRLRGTQVLNANVQKSILVSVDFSPNDILDFKRHTIKGIAAEEGGITSHTAILARGLKMPAIIGIPNLVAECSSAKEAILDGVRGHLLIDPDSRDMEYYRNAATNYDTFEEAAKQTANCPALTEDKHQVAVLANLERPTQLSHLAECGAEGIGLYRTEFSFLSGLAPDEEKLYNEYRQIINGCQPQRAVIRTLDTGADKLLPVQEALHEPNPALGLRGIRFCLKQPELFRTQLRAILRASHPVPAAIMLPMVSTLSEVQQVKDIISEISDDLKRQSFPHASKPPLGVMVETPAAVLMCDALADECDFLSIGTNDLLHYIMAIDRANRHVAYLHEPLHPAFIRALKIVIDAAHQKNIMVSVCGELASDPYGIALLLGLGIDALSAAPRFVPIVKHIIRMLSKTSCELIVKQALDERHPENTRAALQAMLEQTLGSQLPFHNTHILPEQLR